MYTPQCTRETQRTTCGNRLSPSILRVPGTELKLSGFTTNVENAPVESISVGLTVVFVERHI